MKFMVTWKIAPAQQVPAVTRFLKTGGLPSKGVKMLGRWHGPGLGFALAECKEGKALTSGCRSGRIISSSPSIPWWRIAKPAAF